MFAWVYSWLTNFFATSGFVFANDPYKYGSKFSAGHSSVLNNDRFKLLNST